MHANRLFSKLAVTCLMIMAVVAYAQQTPPNPSDKELLKPINGIILAYRVLGRADGKPIMLISGTGMQMIEWPPVLTDGLVRRGYRVVIFDNRDAGDSTHFSASGAPDWRAIFGAMAAGKPAPLPYRAEDMVADAAALLDDLKISKADLLGASGGATIAALLTLAHPERVRSLTLLMANASDPAVPMPADAKRVATIPPAPLQEAPLDQVDRKVKTYKALAGRGYPFNENHLTDLAKLTTERDGDPQGFARQGAALIVLGDLRPRLALITVPTVVIHGDDDALIPVLSGREVANAISGARFILIKGMGHDLPVPVIAQVLGAVDKVAGRTQ